MTGTRDEVAPGLRERAARRLKQRHDLHAHLLVFVLVNGFLVAVWALTTAPGFFWPLFPLCAWGIGLVMHAWDVYLTPEITEADIDREIARMQRR